MPENLGTFSNPCDDVPEKPGTFSNPGIMGTWDHGDSYCFIKYMLKMHKEKWIII
jgi:hypothetical protein